MAAELLLAASALAGAAAFARFRRRAFPSHEAAGLQDRGAAVAAAAEAVRRLAGLDVSSWRAFAALHTDDEVVSRLHTLGGLDRARPFLVRAGLLASWRVRFAGPDATVLVGLSPAGDVIALELSGTEPGEAAPGASLGALWAEARLTGSGRVELSDGAVEETRVFALEDAGVRLRLEERRRADAVAGVTVVAEVVDAAARESARAEAWESVLGLGVFVSALVAAVAGVCVLAFSEGGQADWRVGAALAAALGAGLLLAERQGFELGAVNAYDWRVSWRAFWLMTALTSLLSGVAMAAVVFVSASAGAFTAARAGVELFDDPGGQLVRGAWLACVWLGLLTTVYGLLRARGRIRVAPELSPRTQVLAGIDWRQAVSVAAQSAIGEEAIFRLLGVSLLLWATGSASVAVLVTAILWAATHSGAGIIPRWTRLLELTLVGCALGAAFLHWGFLAVLAAHFVTNLVLAMPPLRAPRRALPADAAEARA